MLLQWHEKDPSYSAKNAGGRLHPNMHTPLTQLSQSGLTMLLSRHSVKTYQETNSCTTCQGTQSQSSQVAEPLCTDPGIISGISVHERISALKKKKKKKAQAGNEWSNVLPKSSQARKKPPIFQPVRKFFVDRNN